MGGEVGRVHCGLRDGKRGECERSAGTLTEGGLFQCCGYLLDVLVESLHRPRSCAAFLVCAAGVRSPVGKSLRSVR